MRRLLCSGWMGLLFALLLAGLSTTASAALNFPANSPVGVAQGVNPGRVVWIHDTNAVTWDGSSSKYYFSDAYTLQTNVDAMVSTSLRTLTTNTTDTGAWQTLFRYHNFTAQGRNVGYTPGENIAILINNENTKGDSKSDNKCDVTPDLVISIVKQLISTNAAAKIGGTNIIVYDAHRRIGDTIANKLLGMGGEYAKITMMQNAFNNKSNRVAATWSPGIAYSDPRIASGSSACNLPDRILTNTTYIINLGLLKQDSYSLKPFGSNTVYGYGGGAQEGNNEVALCGANWFGSIETATNLFEMLRPTNGVAYNPIVDLMGSQYLGGKTILYLIDGLYGGYRYDSWPTNFRGAPFNGWWPSCVMASQDPVAIDSVALDLLNNFSPKTLWTNADNYLKEAALADNPPSGTIYQPDGYGLSSLGVAEHWNDAAHWQYSRDLDPRRVNGIQLIKIDKSARPSITITFPTNNAVFKKDYAINIQTVVNSPFSAPTGVAFYTNSLYLTTNASAPYNGIWNGPVVGTNIALTAVASDSNGARGTSAVVRVTISPVNYTMYINPMVAEVGVGKPTTFTVGFTRPLSNSTFSGNIFLGLSPTGLPRNYTAAFGRANLNITYLSTNLIFTPSISTRPGTYTLTIVGTNGSLMDTASATIIITNQPAAPGPLLWTAGSFKDTNWYTALNWTNLTGGGNGPPGANNDVYFGNRSMAPPGVTNNLLDDDASILSLNFTNANGAHTALIQEPAVLTIGMYQRNDRSDCGRSRQPHRPLRRNQYHHRPQRRDQSPGFRASQPGRQPE